MWYAQQCRWMVDSMWTWHWTVRRTRSVRTQTRSMQLTTPGTPTTAKTQHTFSNRLTVQKPTQQQTHGGLSTLEWICASGASNSQTEETVVVRILFLPVHTRPPLGIFVIFGRRGPPISGAQFCMLQGDFDLNHRLAFILLLIAMLIK